MRAAALSHGGYLPGHGGCLCRHGDRWLNTRLEHLFLCIFVTSASVTPPSCRPSVLLSSRSPLTRPPSTHLPVRPSVQPSLPRPDSPVRHPPAHSLPSTCSPSVRPSVRPACSPSFLASPFAPGVGAETCAPAARRLPVWGTGYRHTPQCPPRARACPFSPSHGSGWDRKPS